MKFVAANQKDFQTNLRKQAQEKLLQFQQEHLQSSDLNRSRLAQTLRLWTIEKTFQDGSRYEGEIKVDGTRQGYGVMWFPKGDFYFGQWLEDQFNGQGTYVFSNGERYEGDLADNLKHGKGAFFYLNGDIYLGNWQDNQK
jgi:hypothetical protein